MVYLVTGCVNLHRSDVCGGDFVRYLHTLPTCYRLSEYGDVLGMDKYGVIAQSTRQKHLQKLKQNARKAKKRNSKQPINAHSKEFAQNKLVQLMKESVPNELDTPFSSLWNMDLHDSLMPFANVELPPQLLPAADEVITIDNQQFNLKTHSAEEQVKLIDAWQKTEHIDKRDTIGPSGFIFALQEFYYNPKSQKLGHVAKTGHPIHYDRTAKKPRAAIIASKNLNLWMETDLSDADMVTCKYITGVKDMPEIYIVSLYADIEEKKNIVHPKLKGLLRKCRKNNIGCMILGDSNSHSWLWGSPKTNDRGKVFEDELIRDFNLTVHNTGD